MAVQVRCSCILLVLVCVSLVQLSSAQNCSSPLPSTCRCIGDKFMECRSLTALPPLNDVPPSIIEFNFIDCQFGVLESVPYSLATSIIFEKCEITEVKDGAFSELENLVALDLPINSISSINKNTFTGLINLTHLDLSSNRLTDVPKDAFEYLPKLYMLSIGGNTGLNLDEALLGSVEHLRTLHMPRCGFTHVPMDMIQQAGKLNTLDLNHNQITHLGADQLKAFPELNSLIFDSNRISKMDDDAFKGVEKLTYLNLGYNQISSVNDKVFAPLNNLKLLLLEQNPLESLDRSVLPDRIAKLQLASTRWRCDCDLAWVHDSQPIIDKRNMTCGSPAEHVGHLVVNVTEALSCSSSGGSSAVALGVAIPVLIICAILIGYYLYRIMRARQQRAQLRKGYGYSAVYKDTVESARPGQEPLRPTTDI